MTHAVVGECGCIASAGESSPTWKLEAIALWLCCALCERTKFSAFNTFAVLSLASPRVAL